MPDGRNIALSPVLGATNVCHLVACWEKGKGVPDGRNIALSPVPGATNTCHLVACWEKGERDA
jgi:hypothetical protein